MTRMNAEEAEGGKAAEAGRREAPCGVAAFAGARGDTPGSRCFGRLPEAGGTGLKPRLGAGALRWLQPRPDLKPAAAAGGAEDSRPFPDPPFPGVTLVDFRHAARHIKAAADAAFGPDTAAGTARSGKRRHVPPHGPRGAVRVAGAPRRLPRKGQGAGNVRREPAFLRGSRRRTDCAAAAGAGFATGSGAVESADRVPVTARVKRSGQSRGRDGGRGVLTFRSLRPGMGRRGPAAVAPRLSRCGGWRPPECASDSRTVEQIALAA